MNMSHRPPNWVSGALAVFRKDFRLELRNKSVLGTLIVFVLGTLFLVIFATGKEDLGARTEAGLLWIVILFSATLGLGRTFLSEEERGTGIFLRLHTQAIMVYIGKLCYSFLTVLCVNAVSTTGFLLLLSVDIARPGLFILTLFIGTFGLVGATTLLAAIIAQTARGGPLLPMLLFPLLIPLLLSAVEATYLSFASMPSNIDGWSAATGSLVTMISFSGVVIASSILLFDYVWVD